MATPRVKLAAELAVYRARPAEFGRDHPGEVVAIKGTAPSASTRIATRRLRTFLGRLGPTVVLIRAVGEEERVVGLTRELL